MSKLKSGALILLLDIKEGKMSSAMFMNNQFVGIESVDSGSVLGHVFDRSSPILGELLDQVRRGHLEVSFKISQEVDDSEPE